MTKVKLILLCIIILINSIFVTGCWNYREIESLAIVAGAAVDKGENARYRMTVEVVKISGGKDTKTESKLISVEGDTIFECARNAISLSGKKLYWSHTKILIISKAIAEDGVIDMIDWFNRDSETRSSIHLLMSAEKTAEEIFKGGEVTESIKSFELEDMIKNEDRLSKAPKTEIWEFANNMGGEGIEASIATLKMKESEKGKVPSVGGTAIFKGDKLVGVLDEEETKDMLFIRNKIKGGIIVQNVEAKKNKKQIPIALEIFKSKTKLKPIINKGKIKFDISVQTIVSLGELGGSINLIDQKGRDELIKITEASLEKRLKKTVKKIQQEFGSDILGFGMKIYEDDYESWKNVKNNWEERFKNIEVTVKAKVRIKNSAMLSKPLEAKIK